MNLKKQKQFKFNFKFILNIINKNKNILDENLILRFKNISSISKMNISEIINLTNEISTIKEVIFDDGNNKNIEIIKLCNKIIKILEEKIKIINKIDERGKLEMNFIIDIDFLINKANKIENDMCKIEIVNNIKSLNINKISIHQIIELVNKISNIKEIFFEEEEKTISQISCEEIIEYLEEFVSKSIFN